MSTLTEIVHSKCIHPDPQTPPWPSPNQPNGEKKRHSLTPSPIKHPFIHPSIQSFILERKKERKKQALPIPDFYPYYKKPVQKPILDIFQKGQRLNSIKERLVQS